MKTIYLIVGRLGANLLGVMFVFSVCCSNPPSDDPFSSNYVTRESIDEPELTNVIKPGLFLIEIDFQEGFEAEAVVIIDEEPKFEVYRETVTTEETIGVAATVRYVTDQSEITLIVKVGEKLKREILVNLEKDRYLGISFEEGDLIFETSTDPFQYD